MIDTAAHGPPKEAARRFTGWRTAALDMAQDAAAFVVCSLGLFMCAACVVGLAALGFTIKHMRKALVAALTVGAAYGAYLLIA